MNDTIATSARLPRIALIFALFAAVLALYWPATQSLANYWTDVDRRSYTHGYLIAALSVWLLWRARGRIAAQPVRPMLLAAVVLLGMGGVWLVAYSSAIQIAYLMLMPAMLWTAALAVFGWPVARVCFFPVAYLYFAVPIWESINFLPQGGTVLAVRFLLRAIGIPAFFDDYYVQVPAGMFEIAGGCSGLHFLIVALALSTLLGELRRDTLGVRIKLAALAVVFAVVTNWIRVFTIILAGHLTNMQHYLVKVDHYNYGWVLFSIAMVVFFVLARRIGADAPQAPVAKTNKPASAPSKAIVAAGIALVALAAPAVWGYVNTALAGKAMDSLRLLPAANGWSGPEAPAPDWHPKFRDADSLQQGAYTQAGRQVDVSSAVYFSQRQGKEFDGDGTDIAGAGMKTVAQGQSNAAGKTFNELRVEDAAGRSWILWYGYEVDGRWFVDSLRAQVWYGVSALSRPRLSRAVVLRSFCAPDCEGARTALKNFVDEGGIG